MKQYRKFYKRTSPQWSAAVMLQFDNGNFCDAFSENANTLLLMSSNLAIWNVKFSFFWVTLMPSIVHTNYSIIWIRMKTFRFLETCKVCFKPMILIKSKRLKSQKFNSTRLTKKKIFYLIVKPKLQFKV